MIIKMQQKLAKVTYSKPSAIVDVVYELKQPAGKYGELDK
jgi:hypothetical protein